MLVGMLKAPKVGTGKMEWIEGGRGAKPFLSTSTSSWVWCCWCGRTFSYGSWLLSDEVSHSTFCKSSCRSCTFGRGSSKWARRFHPEDATPSEGSTPSGCCSRKGFFRLPIVYQQRLDVADLAEFLPCLEFLLSHFRSSRRLRPLEWWFCP